MAVEVLNYINGSWSGARSGKFGERRNPANRDEVVASYTLSGIVEVDAAVLAAKAAYPAWRATPAPKRGEMLFRARRGMEERHEELARALTKEEGKTIRESRGEVQKSLNVLEFMGGEGRRLGGETSPSEMESTFAYTLREPLGVVAAVTPWNFPVAIPTWKIAPALVTGNTVVFKPASNTPVTAKIIVEIFAAAGLPKGVLNMVVGPGATVGDRIVAHPDVRAVSFTGSNEVGCKLYQDASRLQKRVQCEMGGKNPFVVLADADLDRAAAACIEGAFGSTGQRCTATSRAIVDRTIADAFTGKLLALAKTLVVGDGMDEATSLGPSVDERQMATVLEYIEIGKKEGARILCGGERLAGAAHAKGNFVAPTIFAGVTPTMRIAVEEVFGPVLDVIVVDGLDEALRVANGVPFGLSASIFTQDVDRVMRYVEQIEPGTGVNPGRKRETNIYGKRSKPCRERSSPASSSAAIR